MSCSAARKLAAERRCAAAASRSAAASSEGSGGREGRSRLLARGQRLVPASLQLQRAGQPAARLRDGQRLALAAAAVDHLPPRAHGLAGLTGQLGAHRQALQRLEAADLVLAVGPQLERAARGAGAVEIGVHGAGAVGRVEEAAPCALRLARLRPVLGDHLRRGVQPLRHVAVQRAPAQQRQLAVERVAHERMPEGHLAGRPVDQDAAADRLLRPLLEAGDGEHRLGVEALAGDGGHGHGRPRRRRQAGRPEQHRVADAVGQRQLLAVAQLEPGRPGVQPPARGEGEPELRDEEGNAARAVADGLAQARRGRRPEDLREQGGGGGGVQRLQRDLAQAVVAPQLAAEAPDRVAARDVVAPVGADEQNRVNLERPGQRGQHVERRLVGPLEVVEEHGHRRARRRAREHRPDRLEERRPVRGRGRQPQLGQQRGEEAGQRRLEQILARPCTAHRPQHLDDAGRTPRRLPGRRSR